MSHDFDASAALLEQVNHALNSATPLRIQGSGSKAHLGRATTGEVLDTRTHRGIVSYDPTELVLTARAGTPLSEIEAALDANQQMLPCEPPHLGNGATLGGMVASGLSGPRRPWAGRPTCPSGWTRNSRSARAGRTGAAPWNRPTRRAATARWFSTRSGCQR